jgi:hypothetical protein
MTRRKKIFWLVLGGAYVVGLIALIPAHGEICKEGTKASEEACTSYSLLPFILIKIGQALDALGVAITALATIAIAWFTLSLRRSTDRLWDAGEAQRALSEETAERQLRAYLSVEPVHFDFKRGPNQVLSCKVRLQIKNAGQTPAYRVEIDTDFRIGPWPLERDFGPLKKNAIQFGRSIGPSESTSASSEKGQNISTVNPGERLYFIGRILYRDAFGKSRETWSCGSIIESDMLFRAPINGTSITSVNFSSAERHNQAT